MSSSDDRPAKTFDDYGWAPLDIASLQVFSEELEGRTPETDPDFDRFRALYEDPEKEEVLVFTPLYESGDTLASSPGGVTGVKELSGTGVSGGRLQEDRPEEPVEVDPSTLPGFTQGYEEGKSRGFDAGLAEGRAEGFVDGEKQGYEEGFAKGEADARKAGDKAAAERVAVVEDMLSGIETLWENLIRDHETQMLGLIKRITEKVISARIELDEGIVRDSILRALDLIPEPTEIVLNVAPEDYEFIEMVKEDFFEAVKSLTSVTVVASNAVKRGGCRIETAKASVKTDIESRLEAVFSSILEQAGQ